MGTTAQKGAYLNETKSRLKTAINNIGGEVTDETTFRQYVNQLENAYDRLPKTEFEEGESVTLENTLKGKLDFQDGKVGFGQAKQETTNGYQLLDINATSGTKNGATWVVNEDKSITISTSGATTGLVTIPIVARKTLSAGTYYASGVTGGSENTYYFGILSTNWVFRNYNGITQFSVSEESTYSQIWIVIASGTTINTPITIYPMISKVNTSDYEPYTGGYASPSPNWEQIIKGVAGRNIFNVNNATQISNGTAQTIINPNKIDFITGTGVWSNYAYIFKNPEKNTDFTIKAKFKSALARTTGISVYGSNTNDVSNLTNIKADTSNLTANTEKEYSVTFNSGNYNYICFRFWNNYSATALSENVTLNIYEIQLEQGTSATPYLPYNTIEEVVSGKNEWGGVSYAIGNLFTTNADGSFDINLVNAEGTSATTVPAVQNGLVKTLKAGTYTFSAQGINNGNLAVHIVKVNSPTSGQVIQNLTNIVTSKTFTIEEDIEYFVRVQAVSPITYSGTIYAQIEQGSTATDYEPYKTPTSYQLSLGDKKLYDECTIVGSPDNWKFVNNWYKLNLKDIGPYWSKDTTTENWCSFYTDSYSNKFVANENSKCNRLIYESNQVTILNNAESRFSVNSSQFIRVKINGTITTAQQLYEYFTNNETYIVGKLATPIETPITDTTLIEQLNNWYYGQSLDGTTIIEGNGDLPMIIKVRGLKGE